MQGARAQVQVRRGHEDALQHWPVEGVQVAVRPVQRGERRRQRRVHAAQPGHLLEHLAVQVALQVPAVRLRVAPERQHRREQVRGVRLPRACARTSTPAPAKAFQLLPLAAPTLTALCRTLGGCRLHMVTPAYTWQHAFHKKAHLKNMRIAARVQRGVSSAAEGNRVGWCRQPPRDHIVQFLLGRRAKACAAPEHRAAQQQDHKVSRRSFEKYQAAGRCDITHEQTITNEQETGTAHTCQPQSCRC